MYNKAYGACGGAHSPRVGSDACAVRRARDGFTVGGRFLHTLHGYMIQVIPQKLQRYKYYH